MEKKKLTISHLLLLFIISLIIVQVFILNKHSTLGDQLTLINKNIEESESENERISQKIASLSAMAAITQKAKAYGFTSSSQVVSLATSLPLASNFKLSL